jgi:heme/copper-type cytochrome/quinol oxidase subunit 4
MIGEGQAAGDPLRTNEKLKALSSVVANLGTGLFATAVARWFLNGLDGWAMIWIVFGLTAIALAVQLMSFLEPEAANG